MFSIRNYGLAFLMGLMLPTTGVAQTTVSKNTVYGDLPVCTEGTIINEHVNVFTTPSGVRKAEIVINGAHEVLPVRDVPAGQDNPTTKCVIVAGSVVTVMRREGNDYPIWVVTIPAHSGHFDALNGRIGLLSDKVNYLVEAELNRKGQCYVEQPSCSQPASAAVTVTDQCWLNSRQSGLSKTLGKIGSTASTGQKRLASGKWVIQEIIVDDQKTFVNAQVCTYTAKPQRSSKPRHNGGGSAECGTGKVFHKDWSKLTSRKEVPGGWCGYLKRDDDDNQSNDTIDETKESDPNLGGSFGNNHQEEEVQEEPNLGGGLGNN